MSQATNDLHLSALWRRAGLCELGWERSSFYAASDRERKRPTNSCVPLAAQSYVRARVALRWRASPRILTTVRCGRAALRWTHR